MIQKSVSFACGITNMSKRDLGFKDACQLNLLIGYIKDGYHFKILLMNLQIINEKSPEK